MKLGLALAGGGVKGAAHIGVIKALEENGIKIDMISGTSMGSIVASLYAMGYNPEEMLKIFKFFSKEVMKTDAKYYATNFKNSRKILGYGLVSGENLEAVLKECAREKQITNINEIKMPLSIPTVDIVNSKKYVFTNGQVNGEEYLKDAIIEKAVRSSCSYPRCICTM